MHIGNLRSALYAYLFARRHNGVFLLRIEDTDQGRLVEGAIDVIYDTLKRVGITWDEGPDIVKPFHSGHAHPENIVENYVADAFD